MLRRIIAAAALAITSAAAGAADVGAPDIAAITGPERLPYDWSGFWVGAYGGGGWTEITAEPLSTDSFGGSLLNRPSASFDFDASGFVGGAQIGYDRQLRSFVFGIGGELGVLEFDESLIDPTTLPTPVANGQPETSFESGWQGALTARAGFAFDRLLIYGRAGVAFLDASGSTVDSCARAFCGIITVEAEGEDLLLGWTAGAGFELALSDRWSVGGEYRYFDFEALEVSGVGSNGLVYEQSLELQGVHTARALLSYRW